VNSYPFIRADAVLDQRLRGQCAPVLWFLRDPAFILVCALASVTAIVLLQPLNDVRLFVLADPLAVGLLTVSTYAMVVDD
jgi:hypothetical protein